MRRSPSVVHDFDTGQNYDDLKRRCQRSGQLFEDDQFRACNSLIVDDSTQSIFSYRGGRGLSGSSVEWKRPGVSRIFSK